MSEDYEYGAALFVVVLVVVMPALSIVEAARAWWARSVARGTDDAGREARGRMRHALVAAAALALSAGVVQIAAMLLTEYARAFGSTSGGGGSLRLSETAAYVVGGLSIASALIALFASRLARLITMVVIVASVVFHLAAIIDRAGADGPWRAIWALVQVGALVLLLRQTPARAPSSSPAP